MAFYKEHLLIFQRTWVLFPAPAGDKQPPVTPASRNLMLSAAALGHLEQMVHLLTGKHNYKWIKIKINLKSKKYYQLKAKYRRKPREQRRVLNLAHSSNTWSELDWSVSIIARQPRSQILSWLGLKNIHFFIDTFSQWYKKSNSFW